MQQIDKELHTHTHILWYYGNPEHVNPSLNFKKRIENVTLPYQKRVGGGKKKSGSSPTLAFCFSLVYIVWRPAKTTTRKSRCFCALHHHDRMLMSSCHIAFEHRHVIMHLFVETYFLKA